MNKYYILIEPWAVYVKEGIFFESQGGLEKGWGQDWRLVYASSIEHARDKGKAIRSGAADKYGNIL